MTVAHAPRPLAFRHVALPAHVVFATGEGSHAVAHEVRRLQATRVLLVAGRSARAIAGDLQREMGKALAGRFGDVREHVPAATAAEAVGMARSLRADLLLAVGGGSAIGTAKAVAHETGIPILAVPTTYSGSEMTPVAGTTEAGAKRTWRNDAVAPAGVVYDATLTISLPRSTTAASALNALAHCAEGLWLAPDDPVVTALAFDAVGRIAEWLPTALADPRSLPAREQLLVAAMLGGQVFATTGSGPQHKLAHVLGGVLGLPHGPAHAVLLPYVADAMLSRESDSAGRRLAEALRAPEPVAGLRRLAEVAGLPRSLAEMGMSEDDVERIADAVVAEPLRPGLARGFDRDRVRVLLQAAVAGMPTMREGSLHGG